MAANSSLGLQVKVTTHTSQGDRVHNEDRQCIAFQRTNDGTDIHYVYFGLFDGHGGQEASVYAKDHLLDNILLQKDFWSTDDNSILKGIRDGFIKTHYDMWKTLGTWPTTKGGFPSTAGTTATIGFIKHNKMYIGHVGDSAVVLGFQDPLSHSWRGTQVTTFHKPDHAEERSRITKNGGKIVIARGNIARIVWNRTVVSHGRKSILNDDYDEIPFLAVARSLGDFWSYNSAENLFIVSPEPECSLIPIDVNTERCFIFGSDGLWDVISPQDAVTDVLVTEMHNAKQHSQNTPGSPDENWINPSKHLVELALSMWAVKGIKADNTTVVTVIIEPPPPVLPQTRSIQTPAAHGSLNSFSSPGDVPNIEKPKMVLRSSSLFGFDSVILQKKEKKLPQLTSRPGWKKSPIRTSKQTRKIFCNRNRSTSLQSRGNASTSTGGNDWKIKLRSRSASASTMICRERSIQKQPVPRNNITRAKSAPPLVQLQKMRKRTRSTSEMSSSTSSNETPKLEDLKPLTKRRKVMKTGGIAKSAETTLEIGNRTTRSSSCPNLVECNPRLEQRTRRPSIAKYQIQTRTSKTPTTLQKCSPVATNSTESQSSDAASTHTKKSALDRTRKPKPQNQKMPYMLKNLL